MLEAGTSERPSLPLSLPAPRGTGQAAHGPAPGPRWGMVLSPCRSAREGAQGPPLQSPSRTTALSAVPFIALPRPHLRGSFLISLETPSLQPPALPSLRAVSLPSHPRASRACMFSIKSQEYLSGLAFCLPPLSLVDRGWGWGNSLIVPSPPPIVPPHLGGPPAPGHSTPGSPSKDQLFPFLQPSPGAGGKGMSSGPVQLLGLRGKRPGCLLCNHLPRAGQKNRAEEQGRRGQSRAEEGRAGQRRAEGGRARQRRSKEVKGG